MISVLGNPRIYPGLTISRSYGVGLTTNIVPIDLLCHDYPTLAHHEPFQLQVTSMIPFKCVHGHVNQITSVEHRIDDNVRVT